MNHETLATTFFATYFCREGGDPHAPSIDTLPIRTHNAESEAVSHRIKSTKAIHRFILRFTERLTY